MGMFVVVICPLATEITEGTSATGVSAEFIRIPLTTKYWPFGPAVIGPRYPRIGLVWIWRACTKSSINASYKYTEPLPDDTITYSPAGVEAKV